jgi:pyruvate kinase
MFARFTAQAKGKYPIASIETMVAICREAEQVVDYTQVQALSFC